MWTNISDFDFLSQFLVPRLPHVDYIGQGRIAVIDHIFDLDVSETTAAEVRMRYDRDFVWHDCFGHKISERRGDDGLLYLGAWGISKEEAYANQKLLNSAVWFIHPRFSKWKAGNNWRLFIRFDENDHVREQKWVRYGGK